MIIAFDTSSGVAHNILLDADSRKVYTEEREASWMLSIEQVLELQSGYFMQILAVFKTLDSSAEEWVKPLPAYQYFLMRNAKGDDFEIGSNCHGTWGEDGSVYFNSHNCEFFTFANMEDFIDTQFGNKDRTDVDHLYQLPIGRRETGEDVIDEGCEQYEIDESEDGDEIVSKAVVRGPNASTLTIEGFAELVLRTNASL